MRIFSLVLTGMFLASCASSPAPAPAPTPGTAPVAERRAPTLQVAEARRVRVPISAPWLTERLDADYQALPASQVIGLIAQEHPVRLVFDPAGADVLVRRAPGALTVADHLESVCAQADWAYTVAEGAVIVSDIATQMFSLSQPPGVSTVEAQLRGLSSGGGEGGTRNGVSVTLEPYGDELVSLIETVLGLGEGASATVDEDEEGPDPRTSVAVVPSANAVVVTARPHKLREVRRVIDRMNAATGQTVRVHVAIYEVDVTDSESRSLDLSLLRNSSEAWGISVAPSGGTDAAPSTLSLAVVDGGRWDGSMAIYNWLQSAGRTSISFEDTVEVRNNLVATVDSTRTRQFVKSVSREAQSTGSAILESPSVEIDELRTGWIIHVQPTVSPGRVALRMMLSRASLVDEVPYSFDSGRIAGTNFVTDESNRAIMVDLADGETKLVTQLTSSEEKSQKRRTPFLPWVGDGVVRAERDRETVMTVTATVI